MTYLIPVATTTSIGLVQAGANISIDGNGVISTSSGGGSSAGTWTPAFVSSAGGTIAITIATANYVKTGQRVTCFFDFTEATETGGGPTGTMAINGLPFTSISGPGVVGTALVNYFENMNTNQTFITGTIAGASTQVLLWATHQAATSIRLTQNDVKPTTRLVGTITYQSAS